MADLSYGDATRAAQDGTREIYSMVQRIQQMIQQMGNVQQAVSQINTVSQQNIGDMFRQLQIISNEIDQLIRRVNGGSTPLDPRIAIMQQDIAELKLRFATFERFAQDMGNYFREDFQRKQQEHRSEQSGL